MCILFTHFTSFHDCLYYISVHLQVGDRDTGVEQRLVDSINDAQCEKEKTEETCDLLRYKVRCLRKLLVHDVEMTDKELQDLICEVEEYKEHMAKAERQMKYTTSAFLSAHAAMMEVLGAAGKVKYHQTFRKRSATEVRCMFCSMRF